MPPAAGAPQAEERRFPAVSSLTESAETHHVTVRTRTRGPDADRGHPWLDRL